jgi:hypothetical protein
MAPISGTGLATVKTDESGSSARAICFNHHLLSLKGNEDHEPAT